MNIWTVLKRFFDGKLRKWCKVFSSAKDECISKKTIHMLLMFGIILK